MNFKFVLKTKKEKMKELTGGHVGPLGQSLSTLNNLGRSICLVSTSCYLLTFGLCHSFTNALPDTKVQNFCKQ